MNLRDRLRSVLEQARSAEQGPTFPPLPEEPEYLTGYQRGVRVVPDVSDEPLDDAPVMDLEQSRVYVREVMDLYMALESPEKMLLIKALPGVGKTTIAVGLCEELAVAGRRILYSGPRHSFFQDLMVMSSNPDLWYEWLPRQSEEDGKEETCQYADECNQWLNKGYKGMEFCSKICGWDYVNGRCPYHAQRRVKAPIIYGQHNHVVMGHPLEFNVLIGDEYIIPAFCNEWKVPSRDIMPSGMDPTEDLAGILHELGNLAEAGYKMDGPAMLAALGGAQNVLDACVNAAPITARLMSPDIHRADEVTKVPYAHIFHTASLLARESQQLLKGNEGYPRRVLIQDKHLYLLLRHDPDGRMPRHAIWLDATAEERLYETCFRREMFVAEMRPRLQGKVYQVHTRLNGKYNLSGDSALSKLHREQTEQQVKRIVEAHGYQSPGVISFQGLLQSSKLLGEMRSLHFYAARGTNQLEDCDAVIVIGAPMPSPEAVEYQARMVFFERDRPFNPQWYSKAMRYRFKDSAGNGREYDVSGFWGDADLQSMLSSLREAEIIQAAHRARPVNKPVDIWLLTNVPLPELPPDELLSVPEVMGAPEGVDAYLWPDVVRFAHEIAEERGCVTTVDLIRALDVSKASAQNYIRKLIANEGWERVDAARPPVDPTADDGPRRGRPPMTAYPPKTKGA